MAAVCDNNGTGPSPLGGIHQLPVLFCLGLQPLHGGRHGCHNGHNPGNSHHITKTDIHQLKGQIYLLATTPYSIGGPVRLHKQKGPPMLPRSRRQNPTLA